MNFDARFMSRLKCLKSNHKGKTWKERFVHTACFVAVLLICPLLARTYSSLFIGVTYTAVVLPALISANYIYPPTPLQHLIGFLSAFAMSSLISPLHRLDSTLLSLPNLSCLLSQLSFFSLTDHLLLSEHKVSSLYTLIFYNVITYCLSYVTELVYKDWNLYVTVSETSNLKHLSMTVTKLVLEWAKAITFLITVVFLLLVFTLEQALTRYFPTKLYLTLTFLFYASSEKFFVSQFPKLLAWIDLDALDSLEDFYSPVILKLFSITLASLVTSASLLTGQFAAVPLSIYLNIYLASRHTQSSLLPALREQIALLKPYRPASQQELIEWNDICPICRGAMSKPRARVTQCFHLFHGECLRKYLRAKVWTSVCPMCNKLL